VAGGGVLNSPGILQNALWFIDDYSFTANLKLLPLIHFDMILGMDWLEQFSPMHVHWKHKWIQFQYGESEITLQGLFHSSSEPILTQIYFVATNHTAPELTDLPEDLQHLIQQYKHLFEPPVGLPSPRACNYLIPLLPNAKPVAMRPYRYPPKLKDELKKQVADMLQ
jgi:hypothetical protein